MKNRLVLLALLFTGTSVLAAEQCDCTIYPFKPDPPCAQMCSAKLLAGSNYSTLVNVLGLKPDTARKVTTIPADRKPGVLSGYETVLHKTEFEALNVRMRSLSQDEFQLLQRAVQRDGAGTKWRNP
jgi:hypothetical protein